ncbi:GPI-anchored protein LLG1 [Linum grandiflorum]
MASSSSFKLLLCVLCFIFMAEVVNSHFISLEALQANNQSYDLSNDNESYVLPGRNMIQIYRIKSMSAPKKPCKINFSTVNYMPLRRRCMPPYPVDKCCHGLKRVACNHADTVNDLSTKCSEDMFRNIQKWYPMGWFVSHCKESHLGLSCPRKRTLRRN